VWNGTCSFSENKQKLDIFDSFRCLAGKKLHRAFDQRNFEGSFKGNGKANNQ